MQDRHELEAETTNPPASATTAVHVASREAKLSRIRERGIDPYPPRYRRTCDNASAVALFEAVEAESRPAADAEGLSLAGRIVALRNMGRSIFLDLQDASSSIQAMLRRNNLGEDFELLKDLDLGDHLGVEGNLIRTRTGEVTIDALRATIIAKGMRPLPEKYPGLRDTETRYRQRYLDLIANRENMDVFRLRSRVISGIRRFLDERGFLEVDTPVLVPVAAGAHARPFITHHNALDEQLYLRIATELYLKRLIVGGFDKVYEIGRVFRNEGIDQNHNPEFTLLESYEAYADYNDVMEMVEQMVSLLAIDAKGSAQVTVGDQAIDFTPPWRRTSLRDELQRRGGIDLDACDDEELQQRARALGVDTGIRESHTARGAHFEAEVAVVESKRLLLYAATTHQLNVYRARKWATIGQDHLTTQAYGPAYAIDLLVGASSKVTFPLGGLGLFTWGALISTTGVLLGKDHAGEEQGQG